jgi:LysR family transcriptional regulator, nitrogen assimilation regulatory protein
MDHQSEQFISELRYFSAAYEEGNFTRAAARENCTQSGLSMHIKRLEGIVSQQLFDRHARGVTPTLAGRYLYASCADVLNSVTRARQRMLELTPGTSGTISVGVPLAFGRSVLPTVLDLYMRSHPFVDIRITEGASDNLAALVEAGELEAAIVAGPHPNNGLEEVPFFSDRLVLVMGAKANSSHSKPPRTKNKAPLRVTRMEKLKLVLASHKHGLRQALEKKIPTNLLTSDRILEIDGFEARLEFVRSSEWVTIAPALAVTKDVKAGRLRTARIPGGEISLEYFQVKRKGAPICAPCQDFLDLLSKTLGRASARTHTETTAA